MGKLVGLRGPQEGILWCYQRALSAVFDQLEVDSAVRFSGIWHGPYLGGMVPANWVWYQVSLNNGTGDLPEAMGSGGLRILHVATQGRKFGAEGDLGADPETGGIGTLVQVVGLGRQSE
jgi:hypothetical protein